MLNGAHNIVYIEPLVSIGIPVYNKPEGLRRTLEYITQQSYKHLEIIISDNCSEGPEMEAVAGEYIANDSRIKYYRQEINKGALFNFQFVLQKATGEYFMWAADDDEWNLEFINCLVKALQKDPDSVTAFCPFVYLDTNGNTISEPIIFDYSSRHRIIRLIKMCFYHNDICIYGMHRMKTIKNAESPVWYGINEKSPINTAYPRLFYLLSSGNFVLVGSSHLFFKRLNTESGRKEHYVPYVTDRRNPLFAYFAFIFLKLNALYESERSIWKVTQSKLTVFFCFFPLISEVIYDCVNIPPKVNYFFRKKRPSKITQTMVLLRWYT